MTMISSESWGSFLRSATSTTQLAASSRSQVDAPKRPMKSTVTVIEKRCQLWSEGLKKKDMPTVHGLRTKPQWHGQLQQWHPVTWIPKASPVTTEERHQFAAFVHVLYGPVESIRSFSNELLSHFRTKTWSLNCKQWFSFCTEGIKHKAKQRTILYFRIL